MYHDPEEEAQGDDVDDGGYPAGVYGFCARIHRIGGPPPPHRQDEEEENVSDFEKWCEERALDLAEGLPFDVAKQFNISDWKALLGRLRSALIEASQFHAPKDPICAICGDCLAANTPAPKPIDDYDAQLDEEAYAASNTEEEMEAFKAGAHFAARLGLIARLEDAMPSAAEINLEPINRSRDYDHDTLAMGAFRDGSNWAFSTLRKRISGER